MSNLTLPAADRLNELLDYNPDSGILTWKPRVDSIRGWNQRYAGQHAGTVAPDKIKVAVDDKQYAAHRLIWKMVYEYDPDIIDHQDGDFYNNRISNLRNVSKQGNACNQKRRRKDLAAGVYWKPDRRKWLAKIVVNYREVGLGHFSDYEDAVIARKAGEARYGFHPNHGRF